MSKVLVISDIHLHRWSYGSTVTKEGFNSRLVGQFDYLMSLGPLAREREVRDIICLGDLFHTNSTIHAEVLMAATCAAQRLKWEYDINFHCLVGNHDMASKNGEIHSLYWLRQGGTVIDKPMVLDIGGRKISALPYCEDKEKLTEFLKTSEEIVLLHQGINLNDSIGSAWVINEIFTKEMVPESTKLVLTGHYHRPVDDGKIHIVGSPMEHTWADYDNIPRGVMLVDLETLAIERIENTFSPRFFKASYNEATVGQLDNKFVRLTGVPIDKVEKTREDIMNLGACSVEFEILSKDDKKEIVPVFTSLEQVVKEYDEAVDGRRREVGNLIRTNTYETPVI